MAGTAAATADEETGLLRHEHDEYGHEHDHNHRPHRHHERHQQKRQHHHKAPSSPSTTSSSTAVRTASTADPPSSTASSVRSASQLSRPRTSSSTSSASLSSRRRRRRRRRNGGTTSPSSSSSSNSTNRTLAVAFASAILSALCAGSITVFSLYAPMFQSRLGYTQFEVNGVAIAGSLSSYLPVPFLGYICDRLGPAPLSLAAAVMFGSGYFLAAAVFASVDAAVRNGGSGGGGGTGVSYCLMIAAFVCIGVGTSCMYLSAITTCAKNFGKGKHRGLALAVPIAAFGLSGMWQSQLGSRLLYERTASGRGRGDVDVFLFFVFLAVLLSMVGVLGFFNLSIVHEEELIDEAVEELERSGFLDGSALFTPGGGGSRPAPAPASAGGYGTVTERSNPFDEVGGHGRDSEGGDSDDDDSDGDPSALLLDPSRDPEEASEESEARKRKDWVLNAETRRFVSDHTMWLFAAGFLFMVGPGEAFLNNMGTVIKTLYPAPPSSSGGPAAAAADHHETTSAATHLSIVGVTSTVARLATGTLTDLLAPSPQARHMQLSGSQTLDPAGGPTGGRTGRTRWWRLRWLHRRPSVSRVAFLLFFALCLSLGFAVLASGLVQGHASSRFWVVSALVGAGYGAVFSLTPIIITVIWGVENFATNWGIVATMPAIGATTWGLVYSAVYQAGASAVASSGPDDGGGGGGDIFCYGTRCYAPTFWAMSVSVWVACVLVLLAWKGRNGWSQRGIVI